MVEKVRGRQQLPKPRITPADSAQKETAVGRAECLQSSSDELAIRRRLVVAKLKQCDAAILDLETQNGYCEKENRDKTVFLDLAGMAHEDRIAALINEFQHTQEATNALSLKSADEVAKCGKLEAAVRDGQARLAAEDGKMNELQALQQSQDWLSMAQLSLTKQMHSAAQEVKDYIQRVVRERAVVESRKKKLYNDLQELKGNVRVFCRYRPLLEKEVVDELLPARFEISKDCYTVTVYSQARMNVTGHTEVEEAHAFTVDGIFPPTASQAVVFQELAQLVQSALDGYNVSIFAYGQTGSGKTFTMEGPEQTSSTMISSPDARLPTYGMIPRAVNLIFDSIKELKSKGWVYSADVSILEIYNETVRDLLAESTAQHQCDIKFDAKGNVSVPNLKIVAVGDSSHVMKLLGSAARNRTSAATQTNDRSSRSHSVFQLSLYGDNSFTKESIKGVLSLIDLAGSERVDKSQVSGDRLRETQNINKSLSSLGDVIAALGSKKREHIPFRNSKLTMLLKDSLGGNAKTLMLVNMSPLQHHLSETINSLRFAAKVNSCAVGVAKRNVIQGK